MIRVFFWLVIAGLHQRSFAFQPMMPRTSIIERKIQETDFHTTSLIRRTLTKKSNHHDTDEINPSPAIDRRSMIKATTCALLFTVPFTQGQEASYAVPGLVQFPCNHRLMNTYHFMRAGESLLEAKDLISTNPLTLTNHEDTLSPLGVEQVQDACREMMARDINPSVVKYSLAAKSMDSANVVASEMKIGRNRIVPEYTFMDPRGIGRWDMQRLSKTEEAVWALDHAKSGKYGRGGLPPSHDDGTPNETLSNQVTRLTELLSCLETHCSGDTILLIFPDGTGPALLSALMGGIPLNRVHELNFEPGEIRYDVTYSRVLQDMPSDPLPSYKAAIARGTTTLEQYESDPNQFLDLREEERLAEEELGRKLAQKEIDLREKEVLAQNEEIHRKLAQKEIDLQEKEILAQKEVRRKLAQKEIDLRHKEILTQKEEVRRKLAQKEIHLRDKEIFAQEELRRKLAKKDTNVREKILDQKDLRRELAQKETLVKSIKRQKASTEKIGTGFSEINHKNSEYEEDSDKKGRIIDGGGNKSRQKKHLVVDERKTPDKLKEEIEAKNMPNRKKEFMVFNSKDKNIVADKKISDDQLALDHNKKLETKVGSSPDSPIMALAIAGVMSALKLASGDIEGESENDVNYYPHLEQKSTKQNTTEAITQNSRIISDEHRSRGVTTATIVSSNILELSGDVTKKSPNEIKENHDCITSKISVDLQHLENITKSTPVATTRSGVNCTLDLNNQLEKEERSDSKTYLEQISKSYGVSETNCHNFTSEASELQKTAAVMTERNIHNFTKIAMTSAAVPFDILDLNGNESKIVIFDQACTNLNSSDGLQKMENITAIVAAPIDIIGQEQTSSNSNAIKNSASTISPELQRMESLVESAPFDVPEFIDSSEVEPPKSEETERIDNANKAMEENLSQDDGGSDWLSLMSDLMYS